MEEQPNTTNCWKSAAARLTVILPPWTLLLLENHFSSGDGDLHQLALAKSCWNDHRGDMSDAYHGASLRCYVHVMEQGLCYRVNTLPAYIEANRLVRVRDEEVGVRVWSR